MSSTDAEANSAPPVKLPEVTVEETADEEQVDIPQPWLLAIMTMAMSAMTSITVAGSLFFLLAAPEKVSPQCHVKKNAVTRGFCTASTLAFWTYPVVCCLFVVIVYAKNLVDQRTYYEFLLHKVVIGYGRVQAYKQPVVLALLVYALVAFSALIWYHFSQPEVMASHVYSSLAYITPIISFLAVIFAQWSIQGKLITLPNFLENYPWAVQHLNKCRCYTEKEVKAGFVRLEHVLHKTDEAFELNTPQVIALTEYYIKEVQNENKQLANEALAVAEEGALKKAEQTQEVTAPADGSSSARLRAQQALDESKEWVYWEVRLLFNPRLQDERAQSFKNWALAYMVSVVLAILLAVYVFVCCLITCMEIEQVLRPEHDAWYYTHRFSLRPDLGGETHTNLKQIAGSVAMSVMQTGTRSYYNRSPPGGLLHFQLGAAA